eukprot:1019622-Lingulodinium_polyedra.AAC.1
MRWRARVVHACVLQHAALKRRNARSTTSLRGICRKLRNDGVERAFRHFSAVGFSTFARSMRAP